MNTRSIWHKQARALWRQGLSDKEIASAFSVTPAAVSQALQLVRFIEGQNGHGIGQPTGRGRDNQRTRNTTTANDELDCVAMMEALENGANGSRRYLCRYAEDEQ